MAGSHKTKSSGNVLLSKTNEFIDHPSISGVDLEKRIDVAAYWLVREYLKIKGHNPLLKLFVGSSIKIILSDDRDWQDTGEMPFCNIVFWSHYAEMVSMDGNLYDDSNPHNKLSTVKLEYNDPQMLENTVKAIRNWYQRIIDTKRFKEAVGSPEDYILSNT